MPKGSLYKWDKLNDNAWIYGPSAEDRAIVCRVNQTRNSGNDEYRAEVAMLPHPFLPVGPARRADYESRYDARAFMKSNGCYERLIVHYHDRLLDRQIKRVNRWL